MIVYLGYIKHSWGSSQVNQDDLYHKLKKNYGIAIFEIGCYISKRILSSWKTSRKNNLNKEFFKDGDNGLLKS